MAESDGRLKRAPRSDVLPSKGHVQPPAPRELAYEDVLDIRLAHERCVSCSDRLAILMLAVVPLAADVKTLEDWAYAAHVSVGSLRGYCSAVGIRPKRALDFARLLRAVLRSNRGSWEPAQWLVVSDPRHLRRLLARGGLPQLQQTDPPTIQTYLEHQSLIPLQSAALRCVATRLGHLPVRGPLD
jgi:hypothetical protein